MRLLPLLALSLAVGIAHAQQGSFIDVSGNLAYRERIALPPNAEIVIRVLDTSRADAPAQPLAEKRLIANGAQPPIPFVLTVDRDLVRPGARITLTADIYRGRTLLFTTRGIHPVLTNDQPAHADLMLVAVAGRTR